MLRQQQPAATVQSKLAAYLLSPQVVQTVADTHAPAAAVIQGLDNAHNHNPATVDRSCILVAKSRTPAVPAGLGHSHTKLQCHHGDQ
jgi:hypothetical protein